MPTTSCRGILAAPVTSQATDGSPDRATPVCQRPTKVQQIQVAMPVRLPRPTWATDRQVQVAMPALLSSIEARPLAQLQVAHRPRWHAGRRSQTLMLGIERPHFPRPCLEGQEPRPPASPTFPRTFTKATATRPFSPARRHPSAQPS